MCSNVQMNNGIKLQTGKQRPVFKTRVVEKMFFMQL
jgi:hypothetical protein